MYSFEISLIVDSPAAGNPTIISLITQTFQEARE